MCTILSLIRCICPRGDSPGNKKPADRKGCRLSDPGSFSYKFLPFLVCHRLRAPVLTHQSPRATKRNPPPGLSSSSSSSTPHVKLWVARVVCLQLRWPGSEGASPHLDLRMSTAPAYAHAVQLPAAPDALPMDWYEQQPGWCRPRVWQRTARAGPDVRARAFELVLIRSLATSRCGQAGVHWCSIRSLTQTTTCTCLLPYCFAVCSLSSPCSAP